MSSDFPPTVLLDVSGFPASANRNVIATNRSASLKVMAVQFVGNVARVSFAEPAAKQLILRNESIVIGDIPCRVRGGCNVLACSLFNTLDKILPHTLRVTPFYTVVRYHVSYPYLGTTLHPSSIFLHIYNISFLFFLHIYKSFLFFFAYIQYLFSFFFYIYTTSLFL